MNLQKVIAALRASGNDAEADWLEGQKPVAFLDLAKVAECSGYTANFYASNVRTSDKQIGLYAAPVCDFDGIDADWLSNVIREVDGTHSLGAGALAEKLAEAINVKRAKVGAK